MNIKYRKFIVLPVMVLLFIFGACKKQLDRKPFNSVPSTVAFKTALDFDNAIRGMYITMISKPTPTYTGSTYYGYEDGNGGMLILPDILSDNLISSSVGRHTLQSISRWIYNGDNTIGLFQDAYSVVRNANAILANIDNGVVSNPTKDNYKGEALAIRALAHFDMARMYCKTPTNPTITAADMGLPYVVSTDYAKLPARESIANTYSKIVADLIQAEGLVNALTKVSQGRLNKAAVAGILAKVYLYMGQWQNAVDAATRSLTDNANVASISQFPGIWKDDPSYAGVLFRLPNTDVDGITIGSAYGQNARAEYVCAYDFYQLYSNTDIRKTTYIKPTLFSGANRLNIIKYTGRIGGKADVNDIKVLRVADVLLIRAEANARLNNETVAVTDLNTLKQNRYNPYTPYVFVDQPTLLKEILKERRLELAFEGDRFFDLKRTNQDIVRNDTFGDRADGTGDSYPADATTLSKTDHRMQLPFPQTEIRVNTNFKQNLGY